ncbi:MAG: hypothetical protein FWB90_05165 [Fibromonadales bacterium]|nr:hypothetical protein [Fibromonadales bacterium]
MKKYSLHIMLLALSAFIVVLAACGNGDIVDLANKNSDEFRKYEDAIKDLAAEDGGLIDRCAKDMYSDDECEKLYKERPPEEKQSSSSSGHIQPGDRSSSSSDDWTPPSYAELSSSSRITQSSAGGGGTSSAAVPRSSASTDPNAYQVPNFTCGWDPDKVMTGNKETQIKINFNKPDGATCSESAWAWTKNAFGMNDVKYAFNISAKLKPSFGGDVNPAGSIKWPDKPSNADEAKWEELYVTITCSGDGKPAGEREVKCSPLTITSTPKASHSGKIELEGVHTYSSSSIYYIGETPKYKQNISVTTEQEYCGDVVFDETLIGSALATGDVGKQVKVVAKCKTSGQKLDSAFAAVIPNPTLSPCSWKDDKTVLAKGQEATPSATISDNYGRCGAVKFSDGFPKVLTESDVGTIKVTASTECGDLAGTITKDCPTLEVKSAIYELKSTEGKVTLPNEATVIEMDLPSDWKPSGTATFFCQVTRDGGNGAASGKIGTGTSAVTITGNDYVTATIPLEWTKNKYSLQVDLKCNNTCVCGVGW